MDQPPPPAQKALSSLKVAGSPQVVRAPKLTAIRLEPKADGQRVGQVETGVELYLIDIVAGWASVLPKTLHVMPTSEGHFWVNADDLGVGIRPLPTE